MLAQPCAFRLRILYAVAFVSLSPDFAGELRLQPLFDGEKVPDNITISKKISFY